MNSANQDPTGETQALVREFGNALLPWFVVVFTIRRKEDGHTFTRHYYVRARSREKAKTAALQPFLEAHDDEHFEFLSRAALDHQGEPPDDTIKT